MTRRNRPAASLLPLLLAMPLAGQDMIGVEFSGGVFRLDSATGATTLLATGMAGKNCLACSDDNRLWTTVRTGNRFSGFHYHLAVVDPFTGGETLPFGTAEVGELVALANSTTGALFGIRNVGATQELVRIDPATGGVVVLAPTGPGLVALALTSAGMRAWSATAGLLQISTTSGITTDPFPGLGGPAGVQYLVNDLATNQTYAGGTTLHRVDLLTGGTSLATTFSGAPDLRGVVSTGSRTQSYGQACAATQGLPNCFSPSSFGAGQVFSARSGNHATGAAGFQIVGFSQAVHAGQALPLRLDGLLGTQNCFLRASADFTIFATTNQSGNLFVTMNLPPAIAFVQFYVQHAVLEPVPGGVSFSNGLRVRPGL